MQRSNIITGSSARLVKRTTIFGMQNKNQSQDHHMFTLVINKYQEDQVLAQHYISYNDI